MPLKQSSISDFSWNSIIGEERDNDRGSLSQKIGAIGRSSYREIRDCRFYQQKIEILERIEVITLILAGGHSDFVLEEASTMEDLPNLTYAQRLRLK